MARILILENNEEDYLEIHGKLSLAQTRNPLASAYHIRRCTTLLEALDLLQQVTFDIAFVDLDLPDSQGMLTLTSIIEGTDDRLPVVVITGGNTVEQGVEAISNGAQDYLLKSDLEKVSFSRLIRQTTERKKVELRLLERENQFETLVKNLPGVVYRARVRKRREFVYLSGNILKTTGYLPVEILNTGLSPITFPEDLKALAKKIQKVLEWELEKGAQTARWDTEYRIYNKDGTLRWIRDTAHMYFGPDSNDLMMDGYLEDITEWKLASEELLMAKQKAEAADKSKSRFLAHVTHEIRTPLNAISGFAQILNQSTTASEGDAEKAGVIQRNAEHLLGLINEILDMSKLDSNASKLDVRELSPRELASKIRDMLENQARDKGLDFTVEVDSGVPDKVNGDELKLRQALVNLIGNSLKFTETGRISVRIHGQWLSKPGFRLILEVEDTGIGIPPEDLGKIFEPFVQSGNYHHTEGSTGLGLPICKGYAQMMGGDLSVESTPGTGSKFTFTALVAALDAGTTGDGEPPEPARGPDLAEVAREKGQHLVLVVDDDMDLRLMVKRLLRKGGYSCIQASSGEKGVEACKVHWPDIILMDIGMEGMDGIQATKTIRALGGDSYAPVVIALSGFAFQQDVEKIFQAGCNEFIPKKILKQELLPKLKGLLKTDAKGGARKDGESGTGKPPEPMGKPIPEDLRERLADAAARLNITVVEGLLGEIMEYDPGLAEKIRQFAFDFDFPKLQELAQSLGTGNQ